MARSVNAKGGTAGMSKKPQRGIKGFGDLIERHHEEDDNKQKEVSKQGKSQMEVAENNKKDDEAKENTVQSEIAEKAEESLESEVEASGDAEEKTTDVVNETFTSGSNDEEIRTENRDTVANSDDKRSEKEFETGNKAEIVAYDALELNRPKLADVITHEVKRTTIRLTYANEQYILQKLDQLNQVYSRVLISELMDTIIRHERKRIEGKKKKDVEFEMEAMVDATQKGSRYSHSVQLNIDNFSFMERVSRLFRISVNVYINYMTYAEMMHDEEYKKIDADDVVI